MSRSRIALIAGLATLIVGGGIAAVIYARSGADPVAAITTTLPEVGLDLSVDDSLTPDQVTVPGIEDGDPARPVGRIAFGDGETSDLVLGELVVAVADEAELDAFLARHQGTVLDSFPGEDGEPTEHLVSIPVSEADPAEAARALALLEPDHTGEYAVSDPILLSMLLIAANEKLEHDIDVSLNWLSTGTGIIEGDVTEAPDRDNPFEWTYLMVGGQVDTGVTGAWQLLDFYGKTDTPVKVAIADGGFFENQDFPEASRIRLASWNQKNPKKCSGGNDCPWHGTDVAVTAVGQIDNGYGTAGVAGQVGELIAIQADGDFWTEMRKIKRVVDEERPAVVNMSFGWNVKTFRAASERSTDRHLKAMRADGALVFASAGNEGRNVDQEVCIGSNCYENLLTIPCESSYAVCVGGYDPETAWLHPGSNYGPAGGGRSVEIYAPFCVVTPFNPVSKTINDTHWTCGTSFSSPFMAGAAAVVKAADPSLGPTEIWEVLRETAHVGGVHFDHHIPTQHQRRVNVLDAVAEVLGVEQTPPVVTITAPADGLEIGISDWFEMEGTAIDFKGQPLPITWVSSIEGQIGIGLDPQAMFEPTAGTHHITARATDVNGNQATANITVEVIDLPPEMSISWPTQDGLFYETEELDLVGLSFDPDTGQPLREGDVEWELMRSGQVEYGAAGHTVEVPGGTLDPGSYQVVFRGYQNGSAVETTRDITVLEVIGDVPNAVITTQFQEAPYGYGGGSGVEFTLTGTGTDTEDGAISGTAFRWLATADTGHVEVLCTGSNFHEAEEPEEFNPGLVITPPGGPTLPPVFGTLKDCRTVDIELGLAPGAMGQTQWTIVLEISDSDHQVGRDVADVLVVFAVA